MPVPSGATGLLNLDIGVFWRKQLDHKVFGRGQQAIETEHQQLTDRNGAKEDLRIGRSTALPQVSPVG
jgi:hypothetical protein